MIGSSDPEGGLGGVVGAGAVGDVPTGGEVAVVVGEAGTPGGNGTGEFVEFLVDDGHGGAPYSLIVAASKS